MFQVLITVLKSMRILLLGLLKFYMVEELGIKLFRNTLLIRNFKVIMINNSKTQTKFPTIINSKLIIYVFVPLFEECLDEIE